MPSKSAEVSHYVKYQYCYLVTDINDSFVLPSAVIMLESELSGVHSADVLNQLMKSSILNVHQVQRVVVT